MEMVIVEKVKCSKFAALRIAYGAMAFNFRDFSYKSHGSRNSVATLTNLRKKQNRKGAILQLRSNHFGCFRGCCFYSFLHGRDIKVKARKNLKGFLVFWWEESQVVCTQHKR